MGLQGFDGTACAAMDSTIADCRKQRKTSNANDPVFAHAQAA
jgi:hypothetical protein